MIDAAVETRKIQRWAVDPGSSTVEFEVEHVWGLHTVCGRFTTFDGEYVVGPGGERIELTVAADSVDTGCAKRDEHLRSADFFGVDEHPSLRFTSSRVAGGETGRLHVSGVLEAVGRRVPLAFDASVRIAGNDLELEATATLDQSRLGMSDGPLHNVRRPVRVRARTRLVRVAG